MRCFGWSLILALVCGSVALANPVGEKDSDSAALRQEVERLNARILKLEQAVAKLTQQASPGSSKAKWKVEEKTRLESTGRPLPADWKPQVGDPVQVSQGGAWWRGQILDVSPTGEFKIHYVGWGDNWDQVVARDRLLLPSPDDLAPANPETAQQGLLLSGPIVLHLDVTSPKPSVINPGPIQSTGRPINADTKLGLGEQVEVQWGSSWWSGEVRSIVASDKILIHYTGWNDNFDEVVSRDRLRINSDK